MEQKQVLINELIPLMKTKKYNKKRQTWYKDNSDLIIVFNIQNSSFGDDYYINLGVIIKKLLHENKSICFSKCHIQERIPEKDKYGKYYNAKDLIKILELWEQWYGTLDVLRQKAVQAKLPQYCTAEAKTFLTMVRLG